MLPGFLRLSKAPPIGHSPPPLSQSSTVSTCCWQTSNGIISTGSVSLGSISRGSISRGSVSRGLLCIEQPPLWVHRWDEQWVNQACLLTLAKARRGHPDTYLRTPAMTATKREHHDGEPEGSEAVKKLKMEDDDPHSPTLQSKVGVIQGPDDASIVELFSGLFYAINTFVQDYFKGAPYSIARRNDEKAFFESLTGSDCKGYLKSKRPGAKEAIMLAAIWNKLINYLLSAPTKAFINSIPEIAIRDGASGNILP